MNADATFTVRDCEVKVNTPYKFVTIAVHLQCVPLQLADPEVTAYIKGRAKCISDYLVNEGFIPDPKTDLEWQCCYAGVCSNC